MLRYVLQSGVVLWMLLFTAQVPAEPAANFAETDFHFGNIQRGVVVEHAFVVRNEGAQPLRVQQVRATAPLVLTSLPADIDPGEQGAFRVQLATGELHGSFDGHIEVHFKEPASLLTDLRFAGEVFSPIEVFPMEAFFVGAQKGQGKEASVEIVNHDAEPLRILAVEHSTERFTTRLESLDAGRRYRLTLALRPDGPLGKHTETILVRTSNRVQPVLKLAANTNLHPRVFTYPNTVDLGTLRLRDLTDDPALLSRTAQTLMLYQDRGSDFRASFSTDIPTLDVAAKRDPQGDRYQTTLALNGNRLQVGPIRGSLFIDTNDPESPQLSVPVSAEIVN